MKLIQPKPDYSSPIAVPAEQRVRCPAPVSFVRYRYSHHSAPSGYDRICDYLDAEEVPLPDALYWAGETILRPWALWVAATCGVFEHSRYDCIREQAVISHARRSSPRIYHFVYGEKSYVRSGDDLTARGHRIVLSVHHPEQHHPQFIRDFTHFKYVSRIITMDQNLISCWNKHAGRDIARWIPHGVDCNYFRPIESLYTDIKTIVFAGTHERDIRTLIQTVEAIAPDPGLRFRLLSKEPDLQALENKFPNVEVIQWLDDEGYRRFLQQADLLLLPLRMSTACNVVLEALACGVPVITTRGGIGAYLDEGSSTMIEPGDINAWCHAVVNLLSQSDAPLRARAHALRYDWSEIARLHAEIYTELFES